MTKKRPGRRRGTQVEVKGLGSRVEGLGFGARVLGFGFRELRGTTFAQ